MVDDYVLSPRGVAVLDYAERAGWTAGQQLLAVLLATGGTTQVGDLVSLPWDVALLSALGAALISLATTWLVRGRRSVERWSARHGFWGDVVVRLVKTFVASVIGSLAALGAVESLGWGAWSAALQLAVLTTLSSLGKGLLARGPSPAGSGGTPSTLSSDVYAVARSGARDVAPGEQGVGPPA